MRLVETWTKYIEMLFKKERERERGQKNQLE